MLAACRDGDLYGGIFIAGLAEGKRITAHIQICKLIPSRLISSSDYAARGYGNLAI